MKTNTFAFWVVLLVLVSGFASSASLRAQEAKTLFVNMPDSLCPLLTKVNRADCIDFLESKMRAVVDNRLGRKSEMTKLTKDYICMQFTEQTSWQMKVLALNDSVRVIATVSTACAPACDSRLEFYSTDWKPLDAASFLTLPVLDDFLSEAAVKTDADSLAFDQARRTVDLFLMKADFAPDAAELIFTFTTPDYLSKEVADRLKSFLCAPLVYQWRQGHFTRKKSK